jgi:hypothetical protein
MVYTSLILHQQACFGIHPDVAGLMPDYYPNIRAYLSIYEARAKGIMEGR